MILDVKIKMMTAGKAMQVILQGYCMVSSTCVKSSQDQRYF